MAKFPEQARAIRDEDLLLEEEIALAHLALYAVPEATPETPPTKSQPKTKSADPNEGLDGPYGVNLD